MAMCVPSTAPTELRENQLFLQKSRYDLALPLLLKETGLCWGINEVKRVSLHPQFLLL